MDAFELMLKGEVTSVSVLISVPEIAINEDCELSTWNYDVRFSGETFVTNSETPDACPAKSLPK
jgi:hypothetical protein